MNQRSDTGNGQSGLRAGHDLEGFHIENVTPLLELRATGIGATHLKSGAKFLHIHAPEDSENCFAVTIRTPTPDNTGIPHIIEHSKFDGSKKYPVRNAFLEMAKMSMHTFFGARTDDLSTSYIVATNVRTDFFNLADVYLDSVFNPEISEDSFRQNGHHLELSNPDDLSSPLKVSGGVYSEVKAGYSKPEDLMWRKILYRELCPDAPFSRDCGGDPECIPDLTYSRFLEFNRKFYHPSNALIFTYGDIPTLEHLRFLESALDGFDKRSPLNIAMPRQPRWTAPRRTEIEYPISPRGDAAGRAFHSLNWLVGDALAPATFTDWCVLSTILLGNEAAPLKKALVDSKLGAEDFSFGAGRMGYEMMFNVGLKGSESDRADAFEHIVLETLERLAADPFTHECVEAAFQQLEFYSCEVTPQFPYRILMTTNLTWPYGGDPLAFLSFGALVNASRKRYEANPRLFNDLILHGLLENPHRLRATLRPDKEAQALYDAALAERLTGLRSRMTPEQIAAIAKVSTEKVMPNSPEALATLPQLRVADLPSKLRHIHTEIGQIGNFEVLRNDVFSNGINYLEISMDLQGLPAELYHWLPLFGDVFNKMGVAGQGFEQVAARRAASTGWLSAYATAFNHASDPDKTLRSFRIGLKMLDRQTDDSISLLEDLIFSVDPRDAARLHDVMTQSRAWLHRILEEDVSWVDCRHASRGLSPAAAMDYMLKSPETLRWIETLISEFDKRAEMIMEGIERVRTFLADHARWTLSFTGIDTGFRAMERKLENWSRRVSCLPADGMSPPFKPFSTPPPRDGLAGSTMVAYCAKIMPAPCLAHPDIPLFRIGNHLAKSDYIYPEILNKGCAYGAGANYGDMHGTFTLYSYRDPRIVETLDVFDGLRNYFAAKTWTQVEIDRAIIASSKEGQKPIRPSDATGAALLMHLRGDTIEMRERRYEATLRATPEQVKDTFLRILDTNLSKAAVCVVASRKALEEANLRLGPSALTVSDIL